MKKIEEEVECEIISMHYRKRNPSKMVNNIFQNFSSLEITFPLFFICKFVFEVSLCLFVVRFGCLH